MTTIAPMAVATMDTELQARIKAAIEPYKYDKYKKPPFSVEHLIMMAMIFTERSMAVGEILTWLADTFTYYRNIRLPQIYHHTMRWPYDEAYASSKAKKFMNEVNDAHRLYDLPLTYKSLNFYEYTLEISIDDARYRLAEECLGINRKPSNRHSFFDLPPEIRTKIFDMVFAYPTSGLRYQNWRDFGISSSKFHKSYFEVLGQNRFGVRTQNAQQILSPLLVNKQFLSETEHVFYATNTFEFNSLKDMYNSLSALAPERRQHIGAIKVQYYSSDRTFAAKAFNMLLTINYLQKFTLKITDSAGLSRYNRQHVHRSVPDDEVLKMEGIGTLRKLRVRVVEVETERQWFKDLLERELTQPKMTEEVKQGKRKKQQAERRKATKRKAKEDDGAEDFVLVKRAKQ